MIKGLEELNKIKNCLEIADEVDGDIVFDTGEYEEEESLNIVEKELKALEIILPIIDLEYLIDKWLKLEIITKEKYDLLKEVLSDEKI